MLGVPEDGEGAVELVDGGDDLGAGLGEGVPLDEGLAADELEDGVEVLLDGLDLDFGHVEIINSCCFN